MVFVNVGVVIPARNEEKIINQTLEHLFKQTVTPQIVVVVNDGSNDKTSGIANGHGCFVVDLPDRGFNVSGQPILATVINVGLHHLSNFTLDYVMIMGADHVLPLTYIENIITRMEVDTSLVVASGVIRGEKTVKTHARGSGRIVKTCFWNQFGLKYPVEWGWESWLCYKARQIGYTTRSFSDIITESRPTRYNPNKMLGWGKSMKALGYEWKYALSRSFITFLKHPSSGLSMLRGYLSNDVARLDVADWVNNYQKKHFWKRVKEILTL